jgi:hypothetical protein
MLDQSSTIQIRLDFDDLVKSRRLYREVNSNDSMFRFLLCVIFLSLGIPYLIYLLKLKWDGQDNLSFAFAIAIFFCLLGVEVLLDLFQKLVLWLAFRRNRKNYTEAREVIFDERGVKARLSKAKAEYKWSYFNKGIEGPEHFLLVFGKAAYLIIPKRVFQSEKDVDVFRDLLKSHLAAFEQKLKIPFNY